MEKDIVSWVETIGAFSFFIYAFAVAILHDLLRGFTE